VVSAAKDATALLHAALVEDAAAAAGLSATATAAAVAAQAANSNGRASAAAASSALAKELSETLGSAAAKEWEAAVVANGRVVALGASEPFEAGDVALLVGIEQERRAAKVARLVAAAPWAAAGSSASSTGEPLEYAEADWRSNAVAVGAAFVGRYTQVPREDVTGALAMVGTQHSLVTFAPNAEASADAEGTEGSGAGGAKPSSIGTVAITVVLNPLTEAAQRVAPLLLVLRDQLRLPLQLLLLPELTTTSFPLSKFYRFVASADLGDVAPGAVFADLPKKHVLTMRLGTRQ
jgi:hypothetical protein